MRILNYQEEQALVIAAVRAVTREAREKGDYPVLVPISEIERWIGGGNFGARLISERLRTVGMIPESSRGKSVIWVRPGDVEEMGMKLVQGVTYKGKVSGENLSPEQVAEMGKIRGEYQAYRSLVSFANMPPELRAITPNAEQEQEKAREELAEWKGKLARLKALRIGEGE